MYGKDDLMKCPECNCWGAALWIDARERCSLCDNGQDFDNPDARHEAHVGPDYDDRRMVRAEA